MFVFIADAVREGLALALCQRISDLSTMVESESVVVLKDGKLTCMSFSQDDIDLVRSLYDAVVEL